MLTSPDSTFSSTIFQWLNLTRQFESFLQDCFTVFVNMAISGTKYFHKVVWQHRHGELVSLTKALLQISSRICQ